MERAENRDAHSPATPRLPLKPGGGEGWRRGDEEAAPGNGGDLGGRRSGTHMWLPRGSPHAVAVRGAQGGMCSCLWSPVFAGVYIGSGIN